MENTIPPRKPTKNPISSMLSPGVTNDADRKPASTSREPNIATTRYPMKTEAMAAINTENIRLDGRFKEWHYQVAQINKHEQLVIGN